MLVMAILTLMSWPRASCFSPDPPAHVPRRPRAVRTNGDVGRRPRRQRRQRDRGSIAARLSQSVNDDSGGFHYDQEPRAQNFISQFSKRDLWERRQRKGVRPRRPPRPPAPNRRGVVVAPRIAPESAAAPTASSHTVGAGRGAPELGDFQEDVSANLAAMTALLTVMSTSQSSQTTEVQALAQKVADMSDRLRMTEAKNRMINQDSPGERGSENFATVPDGAFQQKIKNVIDEFDMGSAANSNRGGVGHQGGEYYRTKIAQLETEVDRLSRSMTEAQNQRIHRYSPGGTGRQNFATDPERSFQQKIKNVIDEFDMANAASNNGEGVGQQGREYYRTKIAQLETKVNDCLRATEEKVETKMEDVDMFVNERLDDINDAAFDSMQFQRPLQLEDPFLDERPPPPPLDELPPPPPPPQQSFDTPSFVDNTRYYQLQLEDPFLDGRPPPPPPPLDELPPPPPPPLPPPPPPPQQQQRFDNPYYQERNYNELDVPPPRLPDMSSSQNSVNESSGGHHYTHRNTSFMSSFSQADNQHRRQFQPFGDPRRQQSTRGPPWQQTPPPSRGRFSATTPEPLLPDSFGEPHLYDEGPMTGEDYFYDDMMPGF